MKLKQNVWTALFFILYALHWCVMQLAYWTDFFQARAAFRSMGSIFKNARHNFARFETIGDDAEPESVRHLINRCEILKKSRNFQFEEAQKWARDARILSEEVAELKRQRATNADSLAQLCAALEEIGTRAHCISKAGPLNTPTLADAWRKFDELSVSVTNALHKTK